MVIFHKGKRIEKLVFDQKASIATYKSLRDKGVRVCFVSRVRGYWPKSNDAGPPDPGMLWCPYCREWRWFRVPETKRGNFEPMSEEWMDQLYRRVLSNSTTPWCSWCHISVADFEVKQKNDMWGWAPKKTRRRRATTTRTRRRR